MFLKALGLLTPLAAGGVWVVGGFEGAVAPATAGEEAAVVAEADPQACREVMEQWGRKHGGDGGVPADPTNMAEAMGGTLAVAGKFKDLDDELRSAGCPSIIQGAVDVASGKFSTDMIVASDRMNEGAAETADSAAAGGGGWGDDTPE